MPQLIVTVEGVEIKHVHLAKDRTTLGRLPGSDILLDNLAVSGQHCIFELKGLADVYIEDAGSTNGTFVNNLRVTRQKLADDDVIAISGFRIRYVQSSGESGFGSTSQFAAQPTTVGPPAHATFRVLSGTSAGLEVPVVKAVSTFGKPGISVIAVSHRRTGYFAAHLAGPEVPLLNEKPLGADPVMLADHDEVDLAGVKMLFLLG